MQSSHGVPADHALAPTIFHEPWWLEAASGNTYKTIEVTHSGKVVGRLPYVQHKLIDGVVITHPILTNYLGPAVDDGNGSIGTRTLKHGRIVRELIDQLPATASFNQTFHAGPQTALAFQLSGFSLGSRFSFELAPVSVDAAWKRMRDKTRNVIRKGVEEFELDPEVASSSFARFYEKSLNLRARKSYYDLDIIAGLADAARQRGRGRVIGTRTAEGELSAAIFYAWDGSRAYYLASARDPELARNGAVPFLLWEAIKHVMEMGLTFDFDGSDNEGRTLLYASFGATVTSNHVATRSNLQLQRARNVIKALMR